MQLRGECVADAASVGIMPFCSAIRNLNQPGLDLKNTCGTVSMPLCSKVRWGLTLTKFTADGR